VDSGHAVITIKSSDDLVGAPVIATVPVQVVLEHLDIDIRNIRIRAAGGGIGGSAAGNSSYVYTALRPPGAYERISSVVWSTEAPGIATATRRGNSIEHMQFAEIAGVNEGKTRVKVEMTLSNPAVNLVAYADVEVTPAWNIPGTYLWEDFERQWWTGRRRDNNPPGTDSANFTPWNSTGSEGTSIVEGRWDTVELDIGSILYTAASGPASSGVPTNNASVVMESSGPHPRTTLLGGQNKVFRGEVDGNYPMAKSINLHTPIPANDERMIYVDIDWYPGPPAFRWGFIAFLDRVHNPGPGLWNGGQNGNTIGAGVHNNKLFAISANAGEQMFFSVGNGAGHNQDQYGPLNAARTNNKIYEYVARAPGCGHFGERQLFAPGTDTEIASLSQWFNVLLNRG
jgi:hypothetical protein